MKLEASRPACQSAARRISRGQDLVEVRHLLPRRHRRHVPGGRHVHRELVRLRERCRRNLRHGERRRTMPLAGAMRSSSSRRSFLVGLAGAGALAALGFPRRASGAPVGSAAGVGFTEIPDGALAAQYLSSLHGELPLIKKTFRPPNFETPVEYFRTPITPNKAL